MNDDKNPPCVSLIVRTKNRPTLLLEALHSIVEQTWPKLEIVLVNDGGEDIEKLIESFTDQVSAFKLIQLATSIGRSGAANQGLAQVTGEWVGFLDDDDILETKHVERLVQFAVHNNAKLVYSGTKVVRVNRDNTTNEIYEYNFNYSSDQLCFENYIPIHSVLFARELIDSGICFDTDFDYFEDWDFLLQLSQKTEFMHSSTVTATYRLHEEASGVHQHGKTSDAYLKIYRKWLSDCPIEKIYSLLHGSHKWFDDKIAAIQYTNNIKLDEIGRKHSLALQIVQERDAQLQELNHALESLSREHTHAQTIVQERDAQLQELNSKLESLGREHSHAQTIVQERDSQLQELNNKLESLGREHGYKQQMILE